MHQWLHRLTPVAETSKSAKHPLQQDGNTPPALCMPVHLTRIIILSPESHAGETTHRMTGVDGAFNAKLRLSARLVQRHHSEGL